MAMTTTHFEAFKAAWAHMARKYNADNMEKQIGLLKEYWDVLSNEEKCKEMCKCEELEALEKHLADVKSSVPNIEARIAELKG